MRCCYITITATLRNDACTYKCISKQMHSKTTYSHNGFMISLEFYENYITLLCMEKNKLYDNIILTQTMHVVEITI